MTARQTLTGKPTLKKATVLQRLSRLVAEHKILVDPAAFFEEPFSLPPGPAAVVADRPGRLHLLEQLASLAPEELPETVSAADLTQWLERPRSATLDPRFLPLDHSEGIMAKFNRWFYVGHGEGAFAEGLVPTVPAKDRCLVRAEAALLARLAKRAGHRKPRVLKLGAGCSVEPLRPFFQELGRLDPYLAERCEIVFSDFSPPLVDEAKRRAQLDPVLSRLLTAGQLRFQVLDAATPALADEQFSLIQSGYLYDSLPQRELALVGARWYEFKARPQLAASSELGDFRRKLLSDDLKGLREVPTRLFGQLDWQVVLEPLPPEQVPYRKMLEDICSGAPVAVPVGDALIGGLEALLPHLSAGGAVQTFDLGFSDRIESVPDPRQQLRGPGRIGGALYLPQNFALASRVFADRGLRVSVLRPERYLEEMLGEEVICLEQFWAARGRPQALEEIMGSEFVARFWDCLEGHGHHVFRQVVLDTSFLARSEAEVMGAQLEVLAVDGYGFVRSLFTARERLRLLEGTFEQFRVEIP